MDRFVVRATDTAKRTMDAEMEVGVKEVGEDGTRWRRDQTGSPSTLARVKAGASSARTPGMEVLDKGET